MQADQDFAAGMHELDAAHESITGRGGPAKPIRLARTVPSAKTATGNQECSGRRINSEHRRKQLVHFNGFDEVRIETCRRGFRAVQRLPIAGQGNNLQPFET